MGATQHAYEALRRLADELAERGHSRLPAERALAERLGTSRTTVRAALARLEADGVVRRVRGRAGGAFVTAVPASGLQARPHCSGRGVLRSLNTVKGIPQILHEQGFHDGTTVLRAGLTSPSPVTARLLGLAPDRPVVSLLRLRHAELSLAHSELPGPLSEVRQEE